MSMGVMQQANSARNFDMAQFLEQARLFGESSSLAKQGFSARILTVDAHAEKLFVTEPKGAMTLSLSFREISQFYISEFSQRCLVLKTEKENSRRLARVYSKA